MSSWENIEKWASWSMVDGEQAGYTLLELDLGWYRAISIICALICIDPYVRWRIAGGDPDAPQ